MAARVRLDSDAAEVLPATVQSISTAGDVDQSSKLTTFPVVISNVMLVSVRERRQEIGVRRAMGATKGDIFAGFLFEALAITLSGVVAGIATAWALTGIAVFIPQVRIPRIVISHSIPS
jgi:cell division protein FtsX